LNDAEEMKTTTAYFTDIQLEAFRISNTTTFDGDHKTCPFDTPTTSSPMTTPMPVNVAYYQINNTEGLCFYAKFGLSVSLKYFDVNGTVRSAEIDNVENGTVSKTSVCSENFTTLVIDNWIPEWKLNLNFTRANNKFSLTQVWLNYNLKSSSAIINANDTANHVSLNEVTKWTASVNNSYKCGVKDDWSLNVTGVPAAPELHLLLNDIQVQAFITAGNATHPSFGTAEECASDYTSDIVPIAVGCALAALVVIVLIAYVIGRRRNRARGYESM